MAEYHTPLYRSFRTKSKQSLERMKSMKNFRKALAALLAVIIAIGAIPFAAVSAEQQNSVAALVDFPMGWSHAAMTEAVENGIIHGYEDNTVRPKGLLTRAEMAAIITRAFGAEVSADIAGKFSDVNPDDWFYDEVAKAVQMRVFKGDEGGVMRPNDPITREEAVVVLARALVIEADQVFHTLEFLDSAHISDYAKRHVKAFAKRGYVHGYEDGYFLPKANITREEFAQMMANIFAAYVRNNGAVTLGESEGEVILTGDDVYFYNTVVHGDLIIGDGVGATNVTIENVTVDGRIVFRGGEGRVLFANTKKGSLLVVNDYNGTVNFHHYSDEAFFTDSVYNTPATFLDRTVEGGTASGIGRQTGSHDTMTVGQKDAGTGTKYDDDTNPEQPGKPNKPGTGPVIKNYTVDFDPDNGSSIPSQIIEEGKTLADYNITLPMELVKSGYKFAGWWYEVETNVWNRFTTTTPVMGDTLVKARWYQTSKVTFKVPGGDVEVELETGKSFEQANKFFPSVAVGAGETIVWFDEQGNIFDKTVVVNGDMTVTPEIRVTVTADPDPSKKGDEVTYNPVKNGNLNSLNAVLPIVEGGLGFRFDHWEDAQGNRFDESTPVSTSVTVTPVYRTLPIVTIENPDGVEKYDVESGKTLAGSGYGDKLPTLSDVAIDGGAGGYNRFKGWQDQNGNRFDKDTVITSDVTVKPVYEYEAPVVVPTTFTVSVDADNGTPKATYTIVEGQSLVTSGYAYALNAPKKDGYEFDGWFYTEGGKEYTFSAGKVINANIDVYAKYTQLVSVSYEDPFKAGTTVTVSMRPGKTMAEVGATLPTPEKEGYTFTGWVISGTNTPFDENTNVTQSVVIEPAYEVNKYTVRFVNATLEGEEIVSEHFDVVHGTTLGQLLPGFESFIPKNQETGFLGWFFNSTEVFEATVVESDMRIETVFDDYYQGELHDRGFKDKTEFKSGRFLTDILNDFGAIMPDDDKVLVGFDIRFIYPFGFDEVYFAKDEIEGIKIFSSIIIVPVFANIYDVKFYEVDSLVYTVEDILEENSVSDDAIEEAYGMLSEKQLQGYVANKDNILPGYDKSIDHKINGNWYYLDNGEYKIFDETVVIDRHMDVYYQFNFAKLAISLEEILNAEAFANIQFEAPFDEECTSSITHLDALYLNKNTVATTVNALIGELKKQNIDIDGNGEDNYVPVAQNGDINNIIYTYRLINLLSEETVREYTEDAIVDFVLTDETTISNAMLRGLRYYMENKISDDIMKAFDKFVMTYAKSSVIEAVRGYIDWKGLTGADEVVWAEDESKRFTVYKEIYNCHNVAKEFADSVAEVVIAENAAVTIAEYKAYFDELIKIAKEVYLPLIEEFIDSLHNDETYKINKSSDITDNRAFIINAISKKLKNTTVDEIVVKLPAFVTELFDEDVLADIITETIDAYEEQVNEVKDIINAANYNGDMYYVDTCVDVTINPISDILIPAYENNRLDIMASSYFALNHYLPIIEDMLHYDTLFAKNQSSPSGYAVRSGADYSDIIYKTAVLSHDASEWFVNNLDENELEAVIDMAAKDISDSYARFKSLMPFENVAGDLGVSDSASSILDNFKAKDNIENFFVPTTDRLIVNRQDGYDELIDAVKTASGFDLSQTVTVTVSAEGDKISVSQGSKNVVIGLKDNGFIDFSSIIKSATDKIGNTFEILFEVDEDELDKENKLSAYKLYINDDYVSFEVILK